MNNRSTKFLGALLVLIIALALTLKMELLFGWSFDLVLAVLVAFALTFRGPELVTLVGLSVWIMNWQHGFAPELWVLAGVPLLIGIGNRFQPWRSWLTPALAVALGTIGFYLAARTPIGMHAWFLAGDIVVSVACAYFLLWIFRAAWEKSSKPAYW